ncbi:CAP domain-containing protein [Isoptericola sp. NPDC058082]|uniref:CAP domain-containing protein n=1 Tax=Isoptericola sp. NPDC058082 TaxID=3346331 RepID=UPI0036F14BF1
MAGYSAGLEDLVSAERQAEGLDPLTHDECAASVAASRADELVGAAELEHRPLDDALEECAVELAAENLSRTSEPPAEVVEAWLASAGHAENIRNPRFARAAVACAQDGEERAEPRMVCVQVFLAE